MDVKNIILLLFVPLCSFGKVVHQITNESGSIQSPNYPASYPTDQDITWQFRALSGFKIILYFTQFEIEDSYEEDEGSCVYDYVEISETGKKLHRFCGNSATGHTESPKLQQEFTSQTNKLTLRFVSDYSNEDPMPKGFIAHYKVEDRDECREKEYEVLHAYEDWDEIIYCNHHCHNTQGSYYCSCDPGFSLHTNKHTCTNDCQAKVLSADVGKIKTSRYPQPYSKLAECDWTIQAKDGISIDFRFMKKFEVEVHYEEGCVYDWLQYEIGDGPASEKYCGNNTPNDGEWIRTNSHQVTIMFHSDLTEEEAGFELEYKFNRVRCDNNVKPPSNGVAIFPTKGYSEFEDMIIFNCEKSYHIVGSKAIMCTKDGTWSTSPPKCEAIVCKDPIQLRNIPHTAVTTVPTSFAYGAIVSVVCNSELYEMTSGAQDWICGDEAKWVPHSELIAPNTNNNLPECSPICGLKGNKHVLSMSFPTIPSSWKVNGMIVAAVVRGKKAKNGEWPWMAFIDLYGNGLGAQEFCGGTLVSTRTVITAAHCTSRTYKSAIKVYIGASDRAERNDPFLQVFKVAEMYEHANYTAQNFDHDITILILDKPVVIGKYARPICLPRTPREQSLPESSLTDSDEFQKTGIIAGWGVTEHGSYSYDLNFARLPVIAQKKCETAFEKNKPESHKGIKITDNMVCAGYPEGGKGRDSCQGDSGGPLMFKDQSRSKYFLNGIISFGSTSKCGEGTFGIYTRISEFIGWIDNYYKD